MDKWDNRKELAEVIVSSGMVFSDDMYDIADVILSSEWFRRFQRVEDELTASLPRAWDAGFLDGYDNGSTYGAEGNSINPYIPGDVAGGVYGRER